MFDYGRALAPGERAQAGYAARAGSGLLRMHSEPECPTRSAFQRDRDRIVHSTPFRRLTHKTQVFLYHEGDHYRTRLTHSLEVAQIARTIARQLCLDEDLAEALALAHDLGHPPFGHAGERALNRAMSDAGGFDHNAQSLRIVTMLERKYLSFDGLNLTWHTLEGLAKHNGPILDLDKNPVGKATRTINAWRSLKLDQHASPEAQVAALADDIAYLNHDLDDALRAGLLCLADLRNVPLAAQASNGLKSNSEIDSIRGAYAISRSLITEMITDCVGTTRQNLIALNPETADDIRLASEPVVAFGPGMQKDLAVLKEFLFERVYRHERVMKVMAGAEEIVADLVQRYRDDISALGPDRAALARQMSEQQCLRMISDFVAGMTDRYAIKQHRELFDATPELR